MSGQLATSETILVSAAGVIAADSAGLSSVKSYSALLTSIAAMPLAGGTFTGNVLFSADNTYTIGAAGATRPSAVHVGTGGVTSAGDIIATGASQRYVRAYEAAGVKNVAMYHNGTDGYVVSSAASLVLDAVNNISISKPVVHYGNVQIQAGLGSNFIIGNQAGGYPYLQLTATNGGFLQAGVDKDATLSNQLYMVLSGSNNLSLRSGTGHVMLNPGNSLIPIMGATSAFPAIKRSSTTLAFRLGDDSADAPISCAGITASGVVSHGAYTVATLPAAGSNAGKMAQVTDSNVAASGNYGATVAAGGANRVKVFSDGTNWVIA